MIERFLFILLDLLFLPGSDVQSIFLNWISVPFCLAFVFGSEHSILSAVELFVSLFVLFSFLLGHKHFHLGPRGADFFYFFEFETHDTTNTTCLQFISLEVVGSSRSLLQHLKPEHLSLHYYQ